MDAEFEQRLHSISKEQLIQLLQKLVERHPFLLTEIPAILDDLSTTSISTLEDDTNEDVTEDWDFGGDGEGSDQAGRPEYPYKLLPRPALPPLDKNLYRQRVESYATRLKQQEPPEVIAEDLAQLLQEAELRADQYDYHGALDLYALLFDERLLERSPALTPVLDEAIQAATPALETLLTDASSNTLFDATTATLSPLLDATFRCSWLERLFALWLKYLDTRTSSNEEDLPEIILNVAWDEDIPLLERLVRNELQRQPPGEHTNIVDFTYQYRTRALEKLLRELS